MRRYYYTMVTSIIFFGVVIGVVAWIATYCTNPQTPAQKERELEDIKRQARTFWRGQI